MGQKIVKKLRYLREQKEKEKEHTSVEILPKYATVNLVFNPESKTELYYFQKYAMVLALAHSQLEYAKQLNEYIDYLEKKLESHEKVRNS